MTYLQIAPTVFKTILSQRLIISMSKQEFVDYSSNIFYHNLIHLHRHKKIKLNKKRDIANQMTQ